MRTSIALHASDFPAAPALTTSAGTPDRRTGWHWLSPFRAVAIAPALCELEFNPFQFQLESDPAASSEARPN